MTAAIVTFDPSVHCEDVVLRFRAAPFSAEDAASLRRHCRGGDHKARRPHGKGLRVLSLQPAVCGHSRDPGVERKDVSARKRRSGVIR